MELKNIMQALNATADDGNVKTASSNPAPAEKVSSARNELLGALNEILSDPASEKTASAATGAVGELTKMASDLANADAEALVKEANFWGAGVADGFMMRLGQHVEANGGTVEVEKTASADGIPTEAEFEKFAAENSDLVNQAVELGYYHGKAKIAEMQNQGTEKTAELQERQQVFEKMAETGEGREKLAAIESGYNDTMEKVAAVEQGYTDTTEELHKLANDTFSRGYNDTIRLLQNM